MSPPSGSHGGEADEGSDEVLFASLEHINDVLPHDVCMCSSHGSPLVVCVGGGGGGREGTQVIGGSCDLRETL